MYGQVIKEFLDPSGNHGSLLRQNLPSTYALLRCRIQGLERKSNKNVK